MFSAGVLRAFFLFKVSMEDEDVGEEPSVVVRDPGGHPQHDPGRYLEQNLEATTVHYFTYRTLMPIFK